MVLYRGRRVRGRWDFRFGFVTCGFDLVPNWTFRMLHIIRRKCYSRDAVELVVILTSEPWR